MAGGAVLATALTTHAATSYGLFLDGLDVLKEPATPARYGVALETIDLTLSGPNGVSTLDFVIDDPTKVITVDDGMGIRFFDAAHDDILFTGVVDHWAYRTDFGNQGRSITVSCVGIEVGLDWAVLGTDIDFTGDDQFLHVVCQAILSNAIGLPAGLNWSADSSGVLPISDTYPVQTMNFPIQRDAFNVYTGAVIPKGISVREALNTAASQCGSYPSFNAAGPGVLTTIDPYLRVRIWQDYKIPQAGPKPDIAFTTTGDKVGNMDYVVDASEIVRTVMVIGTGASATVSDGSGVLGKVAVINDTSLTTTAKCTAAGQAYLNIYRVNARGSFELADAATTYGSIVVLSAMSMVDTTVGLTALMAWNIMAADFTFYGAKRDVTIHFGGHAPDAMQTLRRATRTQLS